MSRPSFWVLLFLVTLTLSSSYLFERFISYGRWSLFSSQEWVSGKFLGEYSTSLMGAKEFMEERQAIHGGLLDLSAWHGHQELTLVKSFILGELDLEMTLQEGAVAWFFLDQDKTERFGLRLSRSSDRLSGYSHLSSTGKQLQFHPLPLELPSFLNVRFSVDRDENLQLFVNKSKFNLGPRHHHKSVLTLRGEKNPVLISFIHIQEKEGREQIYQFMPPFNWKVFSAVSLLLFSLVFVPGRFSKKGAKLFGPLLFSLVLCVSISLLYWFDLRYWSQIYLYGDFTPFETVVRDKKLLTLEKSRRRIFGSRWDGGLIPSTDPQVAEVLDLPPTKDSFFQSHIQWILKNGEVFFLPTLRKALLKKADIIFLGTSQLFGAGASTSSLTAAAQLIKNLNQKGFRFTGINLSVPGVTLRELLFRYKKFVQLGARPKLLIVNLGGNDLSQSSQDFSAQLEELLILNRSMGVQTVLSFEPHSHEYPHSFMFTGLKMKDLGIQYRTPFIDTKEYFRKLSPLDPGILWWDVVHLTDEGQRIWAEVLLQSVDWCQTLKSRSCPLTKNNSLHEMKQ